MTETTVTQYLAQALEQCGKTQTQVATEAGYPKPNIITMFKQGRTRVPIRRVRPLAAALGVNPREFLRVVLAEYQPEILETIEVLTGPLVPTGLSSTLSADDIQAYGAESPHLS